MVARGPDSLAPSVHTLVFQLLPWLSASLDPFAHPQPDPSPVPSVSLSDSDSLPDVDFDMGDPDGPDVPTPDPTTVPPPSTVPSFVPDPNIYVSQAGTNGFPREDQDWPTADRIAHRVSPDYPKRSSWAYTATQSHAHGGGVNFIRHLEFEFGPDWIVVPPNHTLDISFKDPSVLDAFDGDENHIFTVKALTNIAFSPKSQGVRKIGGSVEFSPGTYRIGPHRGNPTLTNVSYQPNVIDID
jgi:hypothetical protein